MKSSKLRAAIFSIVALVLVLAFIPVLSSSGNANSEKIQDASVSLPDILASDTSSGLAYALSSTVKSVKTSMAVPVSDPSMGTLSGNSELFGDAALELLNETETEEEAAAPTETPAQPGSIPSVDSDLPYMIVIYIGSQRVVVYAKDAAGAYTVPVKVFTVSTGLGNNTVRGTYRVGYKWRWLPMHDATIYCQYVTQWNGNYLFHSVMYSWPDPGCIDRSAYARLGSKASAGCVRKTVRDAKWIYDNCEWGTYVISTTDAVPNGTPGSAGVPAMTMSNGWDPTDPDERNPYRTQGAEAPVVTPPPTPTPTPTPEPTSEPEQTPELTDAPTETAPSEPSGQPQEPGPTEPEAPADTPAAP